MKTIKNQFFPNFHPNEIASECNQPFALDNCIIDKLDLSGVDFKEKVIIKNCIIKSLEAYSSFFGGGLDFTGNIVSSTIQIEAGGHNRLPIIIANNIFQCFVGFFDCYFFDKLIVHDNIFMLGSDLLTKEDPSFDNRFDSGVDYKNNIGCLSVSPEEVNQLRIKTLS